MTLFRGLSDDDYLHELLELRNRGLDAITALRIANGADLAARAAQIEQSEPSPAEPIAFNEQRIRFYILAKSA